LEDRLLLIGLRGGEVAVKFQHPLDELFKRRSASKRSKFG
jgi:hypothetical protein